MNLKFWLQSYLLGIGVFMLGVGLLYLLFMATSEIVKSFYESSAIGVVATVVVVTAPVFGLIGSRVRHK